MAISMIKKIIEVNVLEKDFLEYAEQK